MKKLLNLGKALNKAEQKNVFGGGPKLSHAGDCVYQYNLCDELYPDDFSQFEVCMWAGDCWAE